MATLDGVRQAFDDMLRTEDPTRLRPVLDDRCTWDDCVDADAVVRTMQSMLRDGIVVTDWQTEVVADRVVASISGTVDGADLSTYFVLLVRDGLVHHVSVADDRDEAVALEPPAPPGPSTTTASVESASGVLPCRDIAAAAAHYERLGFDVTHYDGGAAYGFCARGGVSLHLAQMHDLDPLTTTSAVYLYVDDADALHAEWSNSGANGRFRQPTDTPYGLREGAHIDPDGNLLRYGSLLP